MSKSRFSSAYDRPRARRRIGQRLWTYFAVLVVAMILLGTVFGAVTPLAR